MKLEIIDGTLTKEENIDILRMLNRRGHFDFGKNREYQYINKVGYVMDIVISNMLIKGSGKFRTVKVKLN